MQELHIEQIMTTSLFTVNCNEIVSEVKKIFDKNSFHHILVVNDDGDLEGVISVTDMDQRKSGGTLFRNPKKEEYDDAFFHSLRACDIMTKDLVVLQSNDSVRRAYEIFKRNKIRALPVIDKGKLAGIITPIDILDHFFK